MTQRYSTIKDVARTAGVSTATVSRVINNDSRVRPETRDSVRVAMKTLNYRRNSTAFSLKTNRSLTLGIIAPELNNEFFMKVAEGVESEARKRGYSILLSNSCESRDGEMESLHLLLEKGSDGLIIFPVSGSGSHLDFLGKSGVPLVLIDRLMDGLTSDSVLADNRGGAEEAVSWFLKRGRRRIAFIGGNRDLTSALERYQGYLDAHEKQGIQVDEAYIRFGDFHRQSGYSLMKDLMEQESIPDTVFISNFFMHLGATKYLMENHQALSRNFAVGSFDDMPLSHLLNYTQLTVAQPMTEMGSVSAGLLIDRIEGRLEGESRHIRLDTNLHIHNQ